MKTPAQSYGHKSVVIASGATESGAIDLEHYTLGGLIFGTMTGTAMTFLVSDSLAGTYVALDNGSGSAVSLTIASSKAVPTPAALAGWRFVKLKSGSAEAADRTVTLILKA